MAPNLHIYNKIMKFRSHHLTLKMRSPLRRCWDQRLLQTQGWLNDKNQDTDIGYLSVFPILVLFTDKHQPERIQKKKKPCYFCIFVCLIFHQFYMDSSTFCSCLAAFSWSLLKIKKHLAGMAISMPSLCSFWLVSRLCLNNDICTCVLFWGWDWKLQ